MDWLVNVEIDSLNMVILAKPNSYGKSACPSNAARVQTVPKPGKSGALPRLRCSWSICITILKVEAPVESSHRKQCPEVYFRGILLCF